MRLEWVNCTILKTIAKTLPPEFYFIVPVKGSASWQPCVSGGEVTAKVFGVIAAGEGGLAGDAGGADELGERLFHGHHSGRATGLDAGAELVVVAGADVVAG